jgi:hypothetical protein
METWEALRAVAGRADSCNVGDSKLCTRENMAYLDRHRGRFVTVLPRSRLGQEPGNRTEKAIGISRRNSWSA